MSNMQNFRTAFHGFNRQDVVNYIEYMNNRHASEIQQLKNQLQNAPAQGSDGELKKRLEAAEAKIKELEAALAQEGKAPMNCAEEELEAYRRAERAERIAQERSKAICEKANAILADAGVQVEASAAAVNQAAKKLDAQLEVYKAAVEDAKASLQQTADSLLSIAE